MSRWMIRQNLRHYSRSSGRTRVMKRVSSFLPRIKFHEKNQRRHIIFRSSFFSILPLNRSFQLSFDIGNPIVYFLLAFVYLFQRIHSTFFRSIPSIPSSFQEGKERGEGKKNSENESWTSGIDHDAYVTRLGRTPGGTRWRGGEHW